MACADPGTCSDEVEVVGGCTTWIDDVLGDDVPAELKPACCAKEAKEAREARRVRGLLRAADRTTAATRRWDVVARPPPGADAEADGSGCGSDADSLLTDEDEEGGGGGDAGLLRLRELRLRELRGAAAAAEEARRRGHGSYGEVAEGDALWESLESAGRVVLHVRLEGSEESSALDDALADLAPRHAKTLFVGVNARSPTTVGRLGLAFARLPAVLAFRDGAVTHRAVGLSPFGGRVDFREELLQRWLAKAGALGTGAAREARQADDHSDDDDDDDDDDDGIAPCPDCGRTYPHEHVRAVRAGGQDAGGEEDD